jgi:hypothetical protein
MEAKTIMRNKIILCEGSWMVATWPALKHIAACFKRCGDREEKLAQPQIVIAAD